MKFFFYSAYGRSLPIAQRCSAEGNDVKFYVADVASRRNFDGLIQRHESSEPRSGDVVIYDSAGFGGRADVLRRKGYAVLGGSQFSDDIVSTPDYAKTILDLSDISDIPTEYDLEGWFNGQDWIIGLTSVSVNETRFMPGDRGLEVDCAGTTFCFWKKYRPRSFKRNLYKLGRALRKVQYRGPISTRQGTLYPGFRFDSFQVAMSLLPIDVGKLLADVASGKLRKVQPDYLFGVGVRVSLPPWPYSNGVHPPSGAYPKVEGYAPEWYRSYGHGLGCAVATGVTINDARQTVYSLLPSLHPVEVQYRTDVGITAKRVIPNLIKEQ